MTSVQASWQRNIRQADLHMVCDCAYNGVHTSVSSGEHARHNHIEGSCPHAAIGGAVVEGSLSVAA